jgi:hypothetical protein
VCRSAASLRARGQVATFTLGASDNLSGVKQLRSGASFSPLAGRHQLPTSNGLHYVVQPVAGRLAGSALAATWRIDGTDGVKFREVEPCGDWSQAAVRFMIQRRGDNLTAQGPYEHYRRWSAPLALALGPVSFVVSLSPDHWSSVYAKRGNEVPNELAAALADVGNIGLTYGGCFAGHGVYTADGTANFVLLSYAVQP